MNVAVSCFGIISFIVLVPGPDFTKRFLVTVQI